MNQFTTGGIIGRGLALVLAVVAVLVLCGVAIGGCKGLFRTDPGEVAVERNGGPLDSKGVRGTLPQETGYAFHGLFTTKRSYIASDQQRFYTISTDGDTADNPSATSITVPTKDGVQVSIEGTTNFHTVFTGEGATDAECEAAGYDEGCGDVALLDFDNQFGNREFTESGSSDSHHVWDGDDGWSAFLDQQFKPTLVSTFREEIGSLNCADLVSSCSLIQQGAAASGQLVTEPVNPADADEKQEANLQVIAERVQAKLDSRLEAALNGKFLDEFQVQIEKVILPESIQEKINTAQSAFAGIAEAQANAEAARFEALKNERLAKSYIDSPVLGEIEIAKVLSESDNGSTIILGGGSQGFTLPLPSKR